MDINFKRALILSPHTDDAELGCGGTMNRFLEEGREIFLVVFSKASIPKDSNLNPDIVLEELKESTKEMGIKPKNLIILDYPLRLFSENRQNILDDLIKLKDEIQPDLVFLPSSDDIHQDHRVIFQEGLRAFKNSDILGYEVPWNNLLTHLSCFIKLSEENLKKKIASVRKYKSQSQRKFMNEGLIKSLARVRGIQCDAEYSEAFEVLKIHV